jgi:hypothetical protein
MESFPNPSYQEKHSSVVGRLKEKVFIGNENTMRTIALGLMLIFGAQEAKHLNANDRYDFKSVLGYGLHTRPKEVGKEQTEAHSAYYDAEI